MSAEENKATMRRWFEEGINKRKLDLLDQYFSADFKYHGPGGVELSGLEELRGLLSSYLQAIPDGHFAEADMLAEGDKVVTRFTFTGTHKAELMGVAATNKKVTITGILIERFEGGKAVEEWEEFDALGLMQQIGAGALPG